MLSVSDMVYYRLASFQIIINGSHCKVDDLHLGPATIGKVLSGNSFNLWVDQLDYCFITMTCLYNNMTWKVILISHSELVEWAILNYNIWCKMYNIQCHWQIDTPIAFSKKRQTLIRHSPVFHRICTVPTIVINTSTLSTVTLCLQNLFLQPKSPLPFTCLTPQTTTPLPIKIQLTLPLRCT